MGNYNEIINTSTWQEQSWLNSGGTRNKKILSYENNIYYFKESFRKGDDKFYKYEFYSEVIASFIGEMIGLDVLKYNIAIYKNQIGCLSKSMINNDEELIEAGKYIKAFDNTFIIDNENPKEKYTFELIIKTLQEFSLVENVEKLIDVIIFDSILGNSDRHQENWGFIAQNTIWVESLNELEKTITGGVSKYESIIRKTISFTSKFLSKNKGNFDNTDLVNEIAKIKLSTNRKVRFSPIYDSGCCLGRELTEDKIEQLHKNEQQLLKYINNGKAEIHWIGKKIPHFQLLKSLINNDGENIKDRINILISKFDKRLFSDFINNLDVNIPSEFEEYRISNIRKEFIVKLVTLRIETLQKLINE